MLRKHRALIAGLALLSAVTSADAAVVISQVYGGGGGTNAATSYKNDYVELFNSGTSSVTLSSYSIQYGSSGGTGAWSVHTLPSLTIPAGAYVLIQEGGGTVGATLPTPDATGTLNMSATAGKIALVSSTTALNGACPTTNVVDVVGFGGANCFETAPTAALSVSTGALRNSNGCTDTGNNSTDFTVTTPAPRNSASPANVCGGGTPTLSIADASIAEGASGTTVLTFNVSLSSPAPAGGVSFTVDTTDDTANAASGDYVAIAGGSGNIGPLLTSGTVSVTLNGDALYEADETFKVTLSGLVNATAGDVEAVGTITNDDTAPTLSIDDVSINEGNGSTNPTATFTVSLSAVSGLPVGLDAATADDTAIAGSDYTATSRSVSIPAGQSSAQINVTLLSDDTAEPNETYFVNLSNASGATFTDNQGLGTIVNDDVAVTPSLSIDNVTVTEGGSGTVNAVFTISSTLAAPAGGISVNVATTDDSATTADSDYTALSTTATIPVGQTSTTVTVLVNGDTKLESDEAFFVNLSAPTGGASIGDGQGVGTITNDDFAPDLSIGDASVTEGNSGTTALTFPITLSGPAPAGGISFTVSTADGTATVANNDYAALTSQAGTIAAGASSGSVVVTITGDTAYEPNETLTVTLAGVTQANVTDGSATGTITNDDYLEIHALQGPGLATPLSGSVVTRGNIVTGRGPQGFTMQAPDNRADADPNTSEGIYVYTVTAPTVAVGDMVDVSGTITEFNGLTEITFATITITSNGNPLPTPVEFNASVPSSNPANPTCVTAGSNFECFEFMRVRIADGLVSTGNQRFGSPASETYAEVFVTANGRRGIREPGLLYPLATTAGNMAAGQWDGNPELFEIDADYFAGVPQDTPFVGGTRFNAVGVMGYDFGDYELWATEFNVTQASTVPRPVRDPGNAGELRIGAFNMLRFCDTTNNAASGSDPCLAPTPTTAGFNYKVARLAKYVNEVLKLPDVLGVVEVENLTVLQALASKLTADTGVPYAARLEEGNDVGGIDVGFLVRTDRVSITSTTQLGKTLTWNDPTGSATALLNDRPPLLLQATFTASGNQPFGVMVVHPKSRSCVDQTGGASCAQADVDRNRQKRFLQGKYHAEQIQAFQQAHPGMLFAVVGDFNDYQFSDGWTHMLGAMAGTYDDAANLLDYAPNTVVNPPLWNAVMSLPENERYSFLFTENFGEFQGFNTRDLPTLQSLDHALLSQSAKAIFTGFDYGRAANDAPAEWERLCNVVPTAPATIPPGCPNIAIAASDHDGFVFGLDADHIFKDGFESAQ